MPTRFLNVGNFIGRVRRVARKAANATARDVRASLGKKASPQDEQFYSDQSRVGFNVQLQEAIVSGKSNKPWDLKPGILARAHKFTKSGTAYADVPIHIGSHPNRTLVRWRRVSYRSLSASWIHPGFPGISDSLVGRGADVIPNLPGLPIKPSPTPPNALEARKRSIAKRILDGIGGLFKKEWRK